MRAAIGDLALHLRDQLLALPGEGGERFIDPFPAAGARHAPAQHRVQGHGQERCLVAPILKKGAARTSVGQCLQIVDPVGPRRRENGGRVWARASACVDRNRFARHPSARGDAAGHACRGPSSGVARRNLGPQGRCAGPRRAKGCRAGVASEPPRVRPLEVGRRPKALGRRQRWGSACAKPNLSRGPRSRAVWESSPAASNQGFSLVGQTTPVSVKGSKERDWA